jgi:hypothetical protein
LKPRRTLGRGACGRGVVIRSLLKSINTTVLV